MILVVVPVLKASSLPPLASVVLLLLIRNFSRGGGLTVPNQFLVDGTVDLVRFPYGDNYEWMGS